jgi:prepilin-type processing-associated H-X9-DG protein
MKSGIPGAFVVRLTEFLTLSPTMAFVFLDEHPDSDINPAFWQGRVTRPSPGQALPANRQLPASYHGGGCTFSFADGHQEYKKWLVPQTIQPVTCTYWPWYGKAASTTSDLRDWNWLVLHSIP